MTALHWRSARDLAAALARGELSALELLEHFAARVERVNAKVNAVVATDLDGARARARRADAARARGEALGPLHGLPMTIKDSHEVVGMPTTSGARELAAHRPVRDADAVARLVTAGAVPFGKTNLPLYAGDFQSYNAVYGTTNNPWDVARVPGGSSGGAAAALACGMTPLELGSDIGGSIRNPSHFCGVYGHKPSHGLVSSRGHIPGPPGILSSPDLAVTGPMARCADDLALALGVLAAPAPEDAVAWRVELPPPRAERLRELRVAPWLEIPGAPPVDAEVTALLSGAVERLAAAGLRIAPPPRIDAAASTRVYLRLLNAVIAPGLPLEVRRGMEQAYATLAPGDASPAADLVRGAVGPHHAWLVDNEARHRLRAQWAELFRDVDAVLMPVHSLPAFAHDHSPFEARTLFVKGESIHYMAPIFFAGLATVVGLPSTAFPVGRTRSGLPVGIQAVGPRFEDLTPIALARLAEPVLGGFEPPPDFAD
ncbi:MAG TPA: amidase [Myxococcota bacterium]|nr:amidase [Myxococcota bacterium]